MLHFGIGTTGNSRMFSCAVNVGITCLVGPTGKQHTAHGSPGYIRIGHLIGFLC